jgi:hypothetical protein
MNNGKSKRKKELGDLKFEEFIIRLKKTFSRNDIYIVESSVVLVYLDRITECIKNQTQMSLYEANKRLYTKNYVDILKQSSIIIYIINQNLNPNDKHDGSKPPPSHWSLVTYFRNTKKFYITDTFHNINHETAQRLVWCLIDLHGIIDAKIITKESALTNQIFIPIQQSNWECGYYCMYFIYIIYRKGTPLSTKDIKDRIRVLEYLADFKILLDADFNILWEEVFSQLKKIIEN